MIKTLNYGFLPVAKQLSYVSDVVFDIIETCNGNFYEVRRAYSGSLVAVKV
jgi:hypothetical protein